MFKASRIFSWLQMGNKSGIGTPWDSLENEDSLVHSGGRAEQGSRLCCAGQTQLSHDLQRLHKMTTDGLYRESWKNYMKPCEKIFIWQWDGGVWGGGVAPEKRGEEQANKSKSKREKVCLNQAF